MTTEPQKPVVLGYSPNDSSIKARLFGALMELALPILKCYRSDMYHDACWVEGMSLPTSDDAPFSFLYGVRDSGTSVGNDDEETLEYFPKFHPHVWRLTLSFSGESLQRYELTVEKLFEAEIVDWRYNK